MTEDIAAKNLLSGKTCKSCWYGAGFDWCEHDVDIARDILVKDLLQQQRAEQKESDMGLKSGDNVDLSSLRRPYPLEQTCEHWRVSPFHK